MDDITNIKKNKALFESEIVALLDRYGAGEDVDHHGIGMMAHTLAIYKEAEAQIEENGAIQEFKTGAQNVSAWFTVYDKTIDKFMKLSQKFGLSPKDRELMLKFKVKKKEEDALDDI